MATQAAEAKPTMPGPASGESAAAEGAGIVIKEDDGQVVEMYLEHEDPDART